MNALSRPLWAAVCLFAVLLPATDAKAQFLDQKLLQADQITPDMRRQIDEYVAPQIEKLLSGDAQAVSEGRKKLTEHLTNPNAKDPFRNAMSEAIATRLDPAVNHDSVLVRMNAQIILAGMTDEKSEALVNAGLEDKSQAVQRWAMEALASRAATWKAREKAGNAPDNLRQKQAALIKQVNEKLDQNVPPHPIVVTPALQVYLAIDTAEARAALNDQLNKRLALHKADPNLSYAPEQAAMQSFASTLAIQSPFDMQAGAGLNRAAFRYARLTHDQLKADTITGEKQIDGAKNMLGQSLLALGQVAAGARKNAPADQGRVNGWIAENQWPNVERLLVNDWAVILRAAPFDLNDEQLGL